MPDDAIYEPLLMAAVAIGGAQKSMEPLLMADAVGRLLAELKQLMNHPRAAKAIRAAIKAEAFRTAAEFREAVTEAAASDLRRESPVTMND